MVDRRRSACPSAATDAEADELHFELTATPFTVNF